MATLQLFMPTATLFDLLAPWVAKERATWVFQRFESLKYPPGFTVPKPAENLTHLYNRGDFSVMFLAFRAPPQHREDWAFLEREAAHVLELAGGRQRGKKLEQLQVRIVAKRSKVGAAFTALRALLKRSCGQGVLQNGHPYPKVLFAHELEQRRHELWVDLDTKTIRAELA